jgi:septal ring factor EnvC (AmiA/AmiB activator)
MKALLTLFLLFSLLLSSSVDRKINKRQKELKSKKIEYRKMDKKLSKMAKNILSAKKEQRRLDKKIAMLEANIQNNEDRYRILKKEEKILIIDLRKINLKISSKQDIFVGLVAKNFSMELALEELNQPTKKSVMMQEVYEVYAQKNSIEIKRLKKEINSLDTKRSSLKIKKNIIQEAIDLYKSERLEYQTKKIEKDKIIGTLARDRAIYKKRFNRIKISRRNLERKLAKLRIIKRKKQNALQARELEIKNRKELAKAIEENRAVSIAQRQTRVAKYRGGKTISPLKGARLIKRFGSYIDPIYKFRIFNKSITLKAPHVGSKVRSVLKGKIVFSENSGGMLGKVVIVEHANGIHTIYAKLSKLAPGVHVGKQLARGSIIGKVDRSLMFEVTKENKHMNPLKLIRL